MDLHHGHSGHLQATGRDARGRKQYRYHPQFRAVSEQTKYEHMLEFARVLPDIRRTVAEHMSWRGLLLLEIKQEVDARRREDLAALKPEEAAVLGPLEARLTRTVSEQLEDSLARLHTSRKRRGANAHASAAARERTGPLSVRFRTPC